MLTIEINEAEERVEIYLDVEGATILKRSLDLLINSSQTHDHLMTASWAGTELSEDKQGVNTRLVNHLLIVKK